MALDLGAVGAGGAGKSIEAEDACRHLEPGEQRGGVGNKLGDVEFSKFAHMLGNHGEEVREAKDIQPALKRAREAVAKTGRSAVVNIWVDPNEYAPGTKNQTMYK